jgi:hypothetical protein
VSPRTVEALVAEDDRVALRGTLQRFGRRVAFGVYVHKKRENGADDN